jgi:hypothetical protein
MFAVQPVPVVLVPVSVYPVAMYMSQLDAQVMPPPWI